MLRAALKLIKVTLRILLFLFLIPVGMAGFINFTLMSDWVHQKRYVENYTYDPDRHYSPEALQEDFAIFRGALEESHGGLYWYTPKAEFDAAFEAAAETLTRPMTEVEFVKVIAPLVDLVRDGHTSLRLPLYDSGFVNSFGKGFWPLDLVATPTGTYVERDGSAENALPPGSKILTINGRSVSDLQSDVLSTSSHQGVREPTSQRFTGQVYLLLSGNVLSSAAQLVTMAEENLPNLITLGQETRGAYQGGVGGLFYRLILPNTHLGLTIPRAKYVLATKGGNPPGRGTLPDYEVWPTQEDVAKGKDTVLAFALDLAKEQATENAAAR